MAGPSILLPSGSNIQTAVGFGAVYTELGVQYLANKAQRFRKALLNDAGLPPGYTGPIPQPRGRTVNINPGPAGIGTNLVGYGIKTGVGDTGAGGGGGGGPAPAPGGGGRGPGGMVAPGAPGPIPAAPAPVAGAGLFVIGGAFGGRGDKSHSTPLPTEQPFPPNPKGPTVVVPPKGPGVPSTMPPSLPIEGKKDQPSKPQIN